jgi:hypothetical protein
MGIHIASQQYFNPRLFSRQALTTIDFAALNTVIHSVLCALQCSRVGVLTTFLIMAAKDPCDLCLPFLSCGGYMFLGVGSEATQRQHCWIFVHRLRPRLSGVCPNTTANSV